MWTNFSNTVFPRRRHIPDQSGAKRFRLVGTNLCDNLEQ